MEPVICQFFKYGHCKFQDLCHKKHVKTVCEKNDCDIRTCNDRHPRKCSYYLRYGRCKFLNCSYKHENIFQSKLTEVETCIAAKDEDIAKQSERIETLEKKVLEMSEKLLKTVEENAKDEFKVLNNKFEALENENFVMKEALEKLEKASENVEEQMEVLGPIINDLEIIEFEKEEKNYHMITKYLPCLHGKIGSDKVKDANGYKT